MRRRGRSEKPSQVIDRAEQLQHSHSALQLPVAHQLICSLCCPLLLPSLAAAGRPIPTELKGDSIELKHEIDLEDSRTAGQALAQRGTTPHPSSSALVCCRLSLCLLLCCPAEPRSAIDDEYGNAGAVDPKLLVTTSRDPSSRLSQFAKELRLLFPHSQRVNRGNTVIADIVAAAKANDYSDLLIVHEHRGEPDGLIVCHLPYGPTAYFGLRNVVLRHDLDRADLGAMSEAAPHLIFDKFSTSLGQRVMSVLRFLFPPCKPDSKRIMTFANRSDCISFRHHIAVSSGHRQVELGEVGPRFELLLYQLKLGTVDMQEAETEWVLRPYMNTAKKRKAL